MAFNVPSNSSIEGKICLNACPVPNECRQTVESGCPLRDPEFETTEAIYLFIKQKQRINNEISDNFSFSSGGISDSLVLLNNAKLITFKDGKWFAK